MTVAILSNEDPSSTKKWELACEKKGIRYDKINLTSSDWFERITEKPYNFFLLRPSGIISHYKTLYDERIYIISEILKLNVFPSYEECYIYENKRLLSYFLKARNIPHPKTSVFYNKKEAKKFAKTTTYPVVGKTAIGASGSGVKIFRNRKQLEAYIKDGFSRKGVKRRFGPNRVTGSPKKWLTKALKSPHFFVKKVREYLYAHKYGQKDFILLQEFIPHSFEWRVVKIGKSFFAHKKIKSGEKASGSKGIEYVDPPLSILDFTKDLCKANNFNFMAVDIFEKGKDDYLVNELQTIFGHVQDHILEVDGKPGRYIYKNNHWFFESGDFNTNESYDLRLQTAIELYEKGL